jgi:hypothetical protein
MGGKKKVGGGGVRHYTLRGKPVSSPGSQAAPASLSDTGRLYGVNSITQAIRHYTARRHVVW